MEFFVRAVPPQTCYIHEATHWIAFGTIPPIWTSETGEDDRSVVGPDRDHIVPLWDPDYETLAPILPRLLQDADGGDFLRHYRNCRGQNVEDIRRSVGLKKSDLNALNSQLGSLETDNIDLKIIEDEISALKIQIESAKSIETILNSLNHMVEIYRSRLFSALVNGKIQANGNCTWAEEDKVDNKTERELDTFEVIPKEAWRMPDVKWDDCHLGTDDIGGPRWVGVQVGFQDLLATFPEPSIECPSGKRLNPMNLL